MPHIRKFLEKYAYVRLMGNIDVFDQKLKYVKAQSLRDLSDVSQKAKSDFLFHAADLGG